ncbi:MAG: ABC transporter permease, partial [Candidatus Bathyarchaeota archaeon]|nr:ABC transporter permease [Candidatus Bathyarchaeota archaeon]
MASFGYLIKWELRKVGKFPIPELLLLVVGLQIGLGMFNVSGATASGAFPTGPSISLMVTDYYELFIIDELAGTASTLFLSISLFAAILVALSFSNEMETGMLKTALSRPVRRETLFFAKVVSVLIIICTVTCTLVFVSIILLDPSTVYQFLLAWRVWGIVLLLLVIAAFFVVSIAVLAALLSKSTAVTSLVTIGVVVVFDTIA